MSDTNFMSYDNAQSVLGGFANAIKGKDDPYTTISYADWLNLTDQEKESGKYYITGAPGADGSIQVDLMTKLWENPSPTSEFAAQDITGLTTLNEYDLFYVITNTTTACGYGTIYVENTIPSATASEGTISQYRTFTIDKTNNKIVVSDARKGFTGLASIVDNSKIVPTAIYGIRTTQTIHLNAIASDVSTSADKCMLSDGVTSVEEALTNPDKVECQVGSLYTNKITIDNNSSYRIGNLIIVNVRFTITGTNVPSASILFSGFPIPKSDLPSNYGVIALATNRAEYSFSLNTDGYVVEGVSTTSLPTQMYLISGSYIAED